ncbi:tRNA (cytosine(38)-C(5))-methyltransferase [Leguminivora glycinivorella]|uniref:tRNA (cytosine(38)-C(5))-methyltransferase n=1 Tax=Leguminivora glycinivorella TaxID=1035111 RepID=UPI00200D48F0|nr:tRNA (cytosine(38)-C(5))-methyltransferase [Leguminivora glycinivorella]
MKNMTHRILELYSGIGGMHNAWQDSGIPGTIVAAVDINTVANDVYKHNFPETNLLNRNIQSIKPEEIKKMNINMILMSPPCQPFTRNGKFLDKNDPRTNSFTYLLDILGQLDNVEYILMENVKGFECSAVRDLFIEKLQECQFVYQEFLVCPSTVGVPNSRLRYYCLARRNSTWNFKRRDEIMNRLPKDYDNPFMLSEVLEENVPERYLIPDKFLKRANIFDICYKNSRRSCCFTKAYTHYVEGTGSVFTDASPETVDKHYKEANTYEVGSTDFVTSLKDLKLRFFTPKEVSQLMAFPKSYEFPKTISIKQCYRLLGNSVNVKVISELLKILVD